MSLGDIDTYHLMQFFLGIPDYTVQNTAIIHYLILFVMWHVNILRS